MSELISKQGWECQNRLVYLKRHVDKRLESQAAEINNHLAETLNLSSEIEGLQLELTAALNFEEMYDEIKEKNENLVKCNIDLEAWQNEFREENERLKKSLWVSNGDMPDYGEPVLVVTNGVTQNITYSFNTSGDEETGWFEPYHFGMNRNEALVIPAIKVTAWRYMPIPDSTPNNQNGEKNEI